MFDGTLIDDLFSAVERAEHSTKSHPKNVDTHPSTRTPESQLEDQPEGKVRVQTVPVAAWSEPG